MVDLVRDLLVLLAHRVVRDGRQVDHRVRLAQQFRGELPHVAEVLRREHRLGQRPA